MENNIERPERYVEYIQYWRDKDDPGIGYCAERLMEFRKEEKEGDMV